MKAGALVARNIRRLRVARGLSQEALAVDAEIDRTYVSRLKRGHLAKLQSLPPSKSRSKVIQLAKALIAEMPTKQELPLMTHWLPEPPGIFGDTLSLWEQRLIELRSLPNSVNTQAAIENAKQMIAMKKAED